jgi:hypothetical protein
MKELAEQTANTQLEIIAIQEKRCSGNGLMIGRIIHYTTLGLINRAGWYWLHSYEESIEECFRI